MSRRFVLLGALLLLVQVVLVSGCNEGGPEVVVYTSVDQVFSQPIFREFERQTGIRARAVFDTEETKSTGVANRLIAEARNPQADVFWSGDPVRPFLLIRRDLVEPYRSPSADSVPGAFKANDGTWTGVAARARVLLVNTRLVASGEAPRSIRSLADPRWRGRAAIANPLFGTTTMHVAALSSVWGEAATRDFLEALRANDVRIASSNGEVRRLVVSGEVAFGLTDTDDAQHALREGAAVEVVYPDQDGLGALVMPTAVVLLRGGPNPVQARALIDFLLSEEVEGRMASTGDHMPLRAGVETPPDMQQLGDLRAMAVDYATVAAQLEAVEPWLRRWVGL